MVGDAFRLGHLAAARQRGQRGDIPRRSRLLVSLPLLTLTSVMLLFSNQRRSAAGFVALLLSLVAFAQYNVVRY